MPWKPGWRWLPNGRWRLKRPRAPVCTIGIDAVPPQLAGRHPVFPQLAPELPCLGAQVGGGKLPLVWRRSSSPSPFGGLAEGARYPIAGQQPAAETDRNPARYPMHGRKPLLLFIREGVPGKRVRASRALRRKQPQSFWMGKCHRRD
jgi:hypothetical protein